MQGIAGVNIHWSTGLLAETATSVRHNANNNTMDNSTNKNTDSIEKANNDNNYDYIGTNIHGNHNVHNDNKLEV